MRPLLLHSGCVWPKRNAPHSGCPRAAQPSGWRASVEDVGPADSAAAPAQRLGHRLPHRDHDRREHQVLGRRTRSLPRCTRDWALPSLMNAADAGLVEVRLARPGQQLVDALARAHRHRFDADDLARRPRRRRSALKAFVLSSIQLSFLGAVGEDELERRLTGRRRRPARCARLRRASAARRAREHQSERHRPFDCEAAELGEHARSVAGRRACVVTTV